MMNPIKRVEYDMDIGADVSLALWKVLEAHPFSLKNRDKRLLLTQRHPLLPPYLFQSRNLAPPAVPKEVMENLGDDYPLDFGFF
jgi:hypothetical protein